jgi:hypothetical protein
MSSQSIYKKNNLTTKFPKLSEAISQASQNPGFTIPKKPVNMIYPVGKSNLIETHPKESNYVDALSHKTEGEGYKLQTYKFNSPICPSDRLNMTGVNLYETKISTENSKNKKFSTPSSNRKNSDYCDSNDETKSVSSINTKDTIFCQTPTKAKKSNDFKVKYKTEICKFWDMNKYCKFGDNVK